MYEDHVNYSLFLVINEFNLYNLSMSRRQAFECPKYNHIFKSELNDPIFKYRPLLTVSNLFRFSYIKLKVQQTSRNNSLLKASDEGICISKSNTLFIRGNF